MLAWQVPYLGWRHLPAELSEFEISRFFTFEPEVLRAIRSRYKDTLRPTLFEHQVWAIEFLGFVRFEMTDAPKILPSLCDVVQAGIDGDALLASARRLLYEHRFVIPATRRLGSLVQLAVQSVEQEVLAEIEWRIPLHIRTQWHEALYSPEPGSDSTLLEWLREPPGNFSPSSIERQSKKVNRLLELWLNLRWQIRHLP